MAKASVTRHSATQMEREMIWKMAHRDGNLERVMARRLFFGSVYQRGYCEGCARGDPKYYGVAYVQDMKLGAFIVAD